MRVDFTLINPNLSISLNLADRVLGLAPSKEFSSWLNLVCLQFTIFLIIRIVNFLPIILNVLLIGQDFFNFVRDGFIICAMAVLTVVTRLVASTGIMNHPLLI
jgi:hypothetical protein